jgi:PPM family protein phosphatase
VYSSLSANINARGNKINITHSRYKYKGTRKNNEDFYFIDKIIDNYCCLLVDGLGGHEKEVAKRNTLLTTLNIMTISGNKVEWGHIGDTRTYFFRNNLFESRTKDHSVPQMKVAMGEISESDIRTHPDRNKLLRVMGVPWIKPKYVIQKSIELQENQSFLMCTDGFWEFIDEEMMQTCLNESKTVDHWLDSMKQIVCENGKGKNIDNHTAIALWIR